MPVTINGSAGVTTNTGAVYNGLQTGTAVASTSGTSIDFTSIPSWVKRITVMFQGVSTSGTSLPQIQIGSGSFTTSGYLGSASSILSTVGSANYSSGAILINQAVATQVHYGAVRITNISGNNWVFEGILGRSDAAATSITGGFLSLSGTLDRVRITTVNGTDTFDAGSINIIYE